MATKQRFQNVILGDTIRLQNYLLDNSASEAIVRMVPKVEVYKADPRLATENNPRGLARKTTKVYRPGSVNNELTATPSTNDPEYWEAQQYLHPDQWEVDDVHNHKWHVDRWFLLLDPNADLAHPAVVNPYSPDAGYIGLKPSNCTTTSQTTTVAASGTLAIEIGQGLSFSVGDLVRVSLVGGSVYMDIAVTSYIGKYLSGKIFRKEGAGTFSLWSVAKLSSESLSSSQSPVTTGLGAKTFTVEDGLDLSPGDQVYINQKGTRSVYMVGTVTDYSDITLAINSDVSNGTGTYQDWEIIKVGDRHAGDVQFTQKFRPNRRPRVSGMTANSTPYSITGLVADLEKQPTAVLNVTIEDSLTNTGVDRVYSLPNDDLALVDAQKATSADAGNIPPLSPGAYYTIFGKIMNGGVLSGFFRIALNLAQNRQVMNINYPPGTPPSIYPVPGAYPIGQIGDTTIGPDITIRWTEDPGDDTTLELVKYAKFTETPSDISEAVSVGIAGLLVSYSENTSKAHYDEKITGELLLNSSDGGINWSGEFPLSEDDRINSAVTGRYDPDTSEFVLTMNYTLETNGAIPLWRKMKLFHVEEWNVEAAYDPADPNPWDDIIQRTHPSLVQVVEHKFHINPSMFLPSPRPIVYDFTFQASPGRYYVGTRAWTRVTVSPDVPLSPETLRYAYSMISAGTIRYEVHRISEDGATSKKISSGTIDWFEENIGLFRMDTRKAPLNRAQDCFIVFFVDLPDGTMIRSGKIMFNIIDDLKHGVLVTPEVF